MYPRFFPKLFFHPSTTRHTNKKNLIKTIFVYFDRGISPYSAFGCLKSCRKILHNSNIDVSFISSEQIKFSDWETSAVALVVPGGRSLPFYQSLSDLGNNKITQYVKSGGSYFGICAGAYYASQKTIFEQGTAKELILDGPLNLFSGSAIGPAYGVKKFQYYTLRGAQAASVKWDSSQNNFFQAEGKVYYNGGCCFLNDTENQFTPLANYSDIDNLPTAVIEGNVGAGKVILSGVHFEVNSEILDYNPLAICSPLKKILADDEKYQLLSLQYIFRRLNVPSEDLFLEERNQNRPSL